MKSSPLLFIKFLVVAVFSHEQFSKYLDPWNSLVSIEGQFDKNNTLFKHATCNPCDYLILVYRDYVQLFIDNPQEGKKDNILAFEFKVIESHTDESLWDFDQHKFTLQSKKDIREIMERTTKKGIQWSYQLTLPIQGLILKGHSVYLYENIIPIVTFIFSVLIFVTFPFSGEGRRQQYIQIPRRTPLISLVILSHLQHIILLQIIVLMVKYLLYEEFFLAKSLWYILYMIPFAFITLQIIYLYDAIKTRYLKVFLKVKSARLRDIGLIITFFLGIYGAVVALLLVKKGLWVFAYFGLYVLWQIVSSIWRKTYPYLTISVYYFVMMAYQMFLANFQPLFWFQQQTWKQIAIFWGILVVVFILGSILQKFMIGIQLVNQVLFQESRNIQMGDQGSAKSTQAHIETQSNK